MSELNHTLQDMTQDNHPFLVWHANSCHLDTLAFAILVSLTWPRRGVEGWLASFLLNCPDRPLQPFIDLIYIVRTSDASFLIDRRNKVFSLNLLLICSSCYSYLLFHFNSIYFLSVVPFTFYLLHRYVYLDPSSPVRPRQHSQDTRSGGLCTLIR